jgi:hypothetical protein
MAILVTLTITQLFARQVQTGANYERALACRNQHPTVSAEWDLWNAVLGAYMEDLADIAAEITARITDMQAEMQAARLTESLTHVPMVCTSCRAPVTEVRDSTRVWRHIMWTGPSDCQDIRDGLVITAMVAAGNENVPRDA